MVGDLSLRYKEFDMANYEDSFTSLDKLLPVEEMMKYRELVEPVMEKAYVNGRGEGILHLEAKCIHSNRTSTPFYPGKYEDEFIEILSRLYISEENLIIVAFNLRNMLETAYVDGHGYAIRNYLL